MPWPAKGAWEGESSGRALRSFRAVRNKHTTNLLITGPSGTCTNFGGPFRLAGSAANSLVDVFNKIAERRRCRLNYVIPISDNGGSSSELIRFIGGPSELLSSSACLYVLSASWLTRDAGVGDIRSTLSCSARPPAAVLQSLQVTLTGASPFSFPALQAVLSASFPTTRLTRRGPPSRRCSSTASARIPSKPARNGSTSSKRGICSGRLCPAPSGS